MLLAIGIHGAACAANDNARLVILGNVQPDGACEYSTSADAPMWADGYLDVAFGRSYIAHLLVENPGSDPVKVDNGWRNVWYEPEHVGMIQNRGTAARGGILPDGSVSIPANGRRIVTVDLLGDGFTVYYREFQDIVAAGENPTATEEETGVRVALEGKADGTFIESEAWQFGLTVSLGPLVAPDPAADSAAVPGPDCCVQGLPRACEAGQNYVEGSCSECASALPEVCNLGVGPCQCDPPLASCGS